MDSGCYGGVGKLGSCRWRLMAKGSDFSLAQACSLWILACTGEVNAGGRRRSGFVQLAALN